MSQLSGHSKCLRRGPSTFSFPANTDSKWLWLGKAGKEDSYKTLQLKYILLVTTNIFFQATVLMEEVMHAAENSR